MKFFNWLKFMKNCNDKNSINLPSNITGTYTDDYDISYVHDIIINRLIHEKENIPVLSKKLDKLKRLKLKTQTYNAKNETQQAIDNIEQEIEIIKSEERLTSYKTLAIPLIEKYINLKFYDNDRLKIINQYLILAKKYISIQVSRSIVHKKSCMNCKTSLEYEEVSTDGILRCPECHNEHQIIATLKHIDHFKIQHLNNENDMDNFIKALTRYQGLQGNPPAVLFTKLDSYFKERGFPEAAYIRSLPYNDRGKKGNVNKEMLYTALSSIGYASYYEDINLIGHIYWDWKLPDLTHLKETILRHYTITQKSFYKIPLELRGRISSLGCNYRLYKHLQLVGVPVYKDDFKIAENHDSITQHDKIWKLMCTLSEDDEIYYIE